MGGGFYEMHQHMAAHLLVADIVHGKGQKGDKSGAKYFTIGATISNFAPKISNIRAPPPKSNKLCGGRKSCAFLVVGTATVKLRTVAGHAFVNTWNEFDHCLQWKPTDCNGAARDHLHGFAPILYAKNFALPTLAGIAEITVGGATQTGAHGSGLSNSNLATQVRSMRVVLANGTEAYFGPECRTAGRRVLPTVSLYAHFDEMHRMGNNVLMVTTFANISVWDRVTITVVENSSQHQRIANISNLFGASLSLAPNPPLESEANIVQPWYYGLLHFRLGLSGSDGIRLETEYFVPYKNGVPAIKAASDF
ncbi:hypothetical protein niasHS_017209 [Heterodera schachtii]|uniref:FAD linked oxidase N-terminal domain-containing protein n=1 Tax=Heterodera schachtii TaxID=97005 RepID=A0ABD2HXH0_HETSC